MRCFFRNVNVPMAVIVAAALGLAAPRIEANPIVPGFNTNSLGPTDDGSTGAVTLGFTADFFGTSYLDTYVNNNGNITFSGAQSTYTPTGLGSSYTGDPIIAPFFADVDTRGTGSGVVSYGAGVIPLGYTDAGYNAFGVNWPNVGYYDQKTDKLNNFQMLLVDRTDTGVGNFDIIFNYGQIQWETGDASGGTDGLGGTSAAVGYSNGTGTSGTYYQLPGSLVPGSFLDSNHSTGLIYGSNDGVAGQLLFEVRNGSVLPPTPAPEPCTLLLLGQGAAALLGLGWRGRRKTRTAAA